MRISLIELSNWRAYESATFDFDTSDVNKNCVLIGAPNGYGKTSLFEAITLCIYGKKGLPLLSRSDTVRTDPPYNKFLSNVINKTALSSTMRRLSVKITFITNDQDKIRIERSWYFARSGNHIAGNEGFAIWINDQVQTQEQGQDREEWETELINRYFVPDSLAQFFLFDGEMVRSLARMTQANQVKQGIEGLMGVPILRDLIRSLEGYVRRKRSGIKSSKSQTKPAELAEEIEKYETSIKILGDELQNIENQVTALNKEQKDLFDEFSSFGLVSTAKQGELYQNLKDAEVERDSLQSQLQNKMVSDFSLGLVGKDLMHIAIEKLEADQIFEEWKASKNQGDKGYNNFISSIKESLAQKEVGIPTEYHSVVVQLIGVAWGAIWHPKPDNCPEELAFPELFGSVRSQVKDRFANLIHQSGAGLQNSFAKMNELENAIARIKSDIQNSEVIGPRIKEVSSRLREIEEELAELNIKKGSKVNQKKFQESEKHAKNATLQQITELAEGAKPVLELVKRAEHISIVVDKIIKDIVPLQSDELAKTMSEIYRELSNKSAVKTVTFDTDFNVKLIGIEGQDIRETEMSAGEEQIFSQALISAVVEVSNFDFPMIIDTPLARLDEAHRNSILKHLKNSKRQVIFLSTDTEIIGKFHQVLKENISDTYKLNHVSNDGVGYTTVEKGYF